MRRTIATLMVAGLIGGCGGDEDAGDTQAPTLVLAASSTSIEGGETTAITVTATDNVDPSVTPQLTCDGGTLIGGLLVTTAATSNATITCTGRATDAAGNVGTGTVQIAVKATVASLAVPEAFATMRQGQIGALAATNLPLAQASYTGTIAGKSVTLNRGPGDTLGFMLPVDVPAGAQRVVVQIGTRNYSLPVTVAAAPAIGDPRTVVVNVLTRARDQVDAALAANRSRMSAAQLANIDSIRTTLADGIANVGSLSSAQLSQLATIFQSNPALLDSFASASAQAAYDEALCMRTASRFVAQNITTIAVIGVSVPFLLSPDPVTKLVAATGLGISIGLLNGVLDLVDGVVRNCLDIRDVSLNGDTSQVSRDASTLAITQRIGFRAGQSRSFRMVQTLGLVDSVRSAVTRGVAQMNDLLAVRPLSDLPLVFDDVRQRLGGFLPDQQRVVPSADVSLAGVSRTEVSATKSGAGNSIVLAVQPVGQPTDTIDFTMTLNVAGAPAVQVPAQLIVATPKAEDLTLTLIQGRPATAAFPAQGQDSIELVTMPTKGRVTLGQGTAFTFTPDTVAFGTDQFTYRARNADGVSRTATVMVTINRQFEGTWQIRTETTTTSETPRGLCPNETKSFSVVIAKVSDTLYTTSYEGVPIDLRMSSANDTAGLFGEKTVTYPDPPGTSTDTIRVFVLDSNKLTGAGTFSYTGPNGSSCEGRTTITGTR
jgi:hypothetical protein